MKKNTRKEPVTGDYFYFVNHRGEVCRDIVDETSTEFWHMWAWGNYFEDRHQARTASKFNKKNNLMLQRTKNR